MENEKIIIDDSYFERIIKETYGDAQDTIRLSKTVILRYTAALEEDPNISLEDFAQKMGIAVGMAQMLLTLGSYIHKLPIRAEDADPSPATVVLAAYTK